jgi:hypothetical protein
MIILTPIERESLLFFKESPRAELPWYAARKQQYHRCCGSGRPWYADTRKGLPYNQRWTHWASVKFVKKKKWWDYLYFSVIKFGIRCAVYLLRIFKCFTDLLIIRYYVEVLRIIHFAYSTMFMFMKIWKPFFLTDLLVYVRSSRTNMTCT